jgi:O-antigen ligase
MDGANKNSYSVFALPAMLLAGFVVLHMATVPKVIKAILISCTLPALAVIFMGGNRSGYLGAVLVGLMLFWDQRGKGLVLVGGIAAIVAAGILQYGTTVVLNERLKQTVEGNRSDNVRRDIIIACVEIAWENPIIGVGPQMLPYEIARHAPRYNANVIESHNVFAHVMGGSGLICFSAMIAVGWTLCTWKPRAGGKVGGKEDPLREARRLMRMLIFLWVVRGLFTPEIMYNPSFDMAIGLVIGFCMLADTAGEAERVANSRALRLPEVPGQLATGY